MEPLLLTFDHCPCCYGQPFDGHEDPRLCEPCAAQQAEIERKDGWEMHWASVAEEIEMDRCYYGSN